MAHKHRGKIKREDSASDALPGLYSRLFNKYYPSVFAYISRGEDSDEAIQESVAETFAIALREKGKATEKQFRIRLFQAARELLRTRADRGSETEMVALVISGGLPLSEAAQVLKTDRWQAEQLLFSGLRALQADLSYA